ncbi:alkane 1-monooxygenase [Meinhardsimonia xiamenensis]|jgi:alkane 1-monooxygenase|uniref:Alkane 1-monooxygenase n=1 Tax=Meinhardsimonia xiamenensis TaxID=990712 RepID=A0A1G8ZFL6_9RHOB|nr:alkane 1-monooxygenase [Meinhardsimonia xiamenensis]PRX37687.1 alkane 1-monooxygenase [Meinhardsimonia xiamenensis]SDK13753.1 alkane 1-monooxygenase [Meinhardsimonia xiamenensis]
MIPARQVARLHNALPFWLSLALIPLAVYGALKGGWAVLLVPVATWWLFTLLDAITGRYEENADPQTPEEALFWYRLITLIWFPLQFALLVWMLWYVPRAPHLGTLEKIALFFGMGVISGTIGINYSHELMHQKNRLERWLADLLLASVLYSHFRTEHLLVHHVYVGTPRDAVTARYNEGFHRFFVRVLPQCLASAFRAERERLARKGRPWWDRRNPFWRYWALQLAFLVLAYALSGWVGVGLFAFQAFVAIWQLELVNYVEHYGLTRRYLGNGRFEHVLPRHSWNASHRASNWLLINLQRHSDHHYKPDRRFPLLQNHDEDEAPQLPFSYPLMTTAAMIPPLWRRVMNPRVRAWRRKYYPDITDWSSWPGMGDAAAR